MTILAVFASRGSSTREVAERIAGRLRISLVNRGMH
jgi:menaquinone-dependent protoporphyrinogen IX oxidase